MLFGAVVVAFNFGCRASDDTTGATTALDPLVWQVDRIAAWDGEPCEVWGAPQVREDPDGPVVVFDGEDDALVIDANPISGWSAFTIEVLMWVDAAGIPEQRFLHIAAGEDIRLLMEIRLNPDGQWCVDTFLRSGESQLALIDRARLHDPGRWHWVALRYDGRTMSHFVNGEQECVGDVQFPAMDGGRTSLGARQTRNFWFKGAVREVRFHPVAVAQEELQRVP